MSPRLNPTHTSFTLPDAPVAPLTPAQLTRMIDVALSHPQSTAAAASQPAGKVIAFRPSVLGYTFPVSRRIAATVAAVGSGGFALAASLVLAVSLFGTPNTSTPVPTAMPSVATMARMQPAAVSVTPATMSATSTHGPATIDMAEMISYDVFANAI